MKKYNPTYLRLAAMNMVEENGKLWMSLLNRNGICEVDIATRRAKIRNIFYCGSLFQRFLYGRTEKVGDNLVFAPWNAEKIAVYNLGKDVMMYIPLNKRKQRLKESSDEAKFWNLMRHRSTVYLLGYSYPAIIKIDMEDLSVEYITDWVDEVEENIDEGDDNGYFGDGYMIVNDLALLPIGCMNAVLELNLKTADTRLRKLDIPMKGIGGIGSANGENIWLVGRGDRTNWLSCWNIRTNEIKEIQLNEEDGNVMDPFYAPICTESKVFLMPISASGIYEMNMDTGELMKCNILDVQAGKKAKPLWPYWKTMAPRLHDGKLFYLTCDELKWNEYNVETGELQSYYVSWEEEPEEMERYFADLYTKQKENDSVFSEMDIPLECFVDGVCREDDKELRKKNRYCSVGREIWLNMRRNSGAVSEGI